MAARLLALLAVFWAVLGAGAAYAQGALCQDPGGYCARMLSRDCLSRLGAGVGAEADAAAAGSGDCARQLNDYRDCLAAAAECPGAAPAAAARLCAVEDARALFASAERANDCLGYAAFLRACPDSAQALLADAAMRRLSCGGAAASDAAFSGSAAAAARSLSVIGVMERSAWMRRVAEILVKNFDRDGSGAIDTEAEVAAMDCAVWRALEDAWRRTGDPLRLPFLVFYGFPQTMIWNASRIGFGEGARASALAAAMRCGLSP